jgi:hypothetical protein
MSAHDAIANLHPFKIEFWPIQAIFDDFVLIFCSKLVSKVSTEAHRRVASFKLLFTSRFQKLSVLYTILCFS